MTSAYETNVDDMVSTFDTLMKTISTFSSRVYKGFFYEIADYPALIYMPKKDDIETSGTLSDHYVTLDVLILTRGGANTPSSDVDSLVSIVGEVWQAIEDTQNNDPHWRWIYVKSVDYAFNRGKALVFYIAHLEVVMVKRW